MARPSGALFQIVISARVYSTVSTKELLTGSARS